LMRNQGFADPLRRDDTSGSSPPHRAGRGRAFELERRLTRGQASYSRRVRCIREFNSSAAVFTSVSYFEWVQDLQRLFWEELEIFDRLYRILDRSFQRMLDRARRDNIPNRMAATAIGVGVVRSAKQTRGLFP